MAKHIYDGIEEHDHAIPNWFTALFLGTIVFGLGYLIYFEVGNGASISTEYQRLKQQDEYLAYVEGQTNPPKMLGEDDLLSLVKKSERVAEGKAVFLAKCISCHGPLGGGGIGPNLTDEYWIHGGQLVQIATTIRDGVSDRGMPPWNGMLSETEIYSVTAYVKALEGTRPPGAKAPQGNRK